MCFFVVRWEKLCRTIQFETILRFQWFKHSNVRETEKQIHEKKKNTEKNNFKLYCVDNNNRAKVLRKMTVSNANTNGVVGNGHALTAETNPSPKPPMEQNLQSLISTIILTIYDVVIFLGISIGFILQVSILLNYFWFKFFGFKKQNIHHGIAARNRRS